MALSHYYITPSGFSCDQSYVRVEHVAVSKSGASAEVRWYTQASGYPSFHTQTVTFDYELEGENPIKQAYNHLKTLPEFADAVDC